MTRCGKGNRESRDPGFAREVGCVYAVPRKVGCYCIGLLFAREVGCYCIGLSQKVLDVLLRVCEHASLVPASYSVPASRHAAAARYAGAAVSWAVGSTIGYSRT